MDRSWVYRPPMHIGDRVIWSPNDVRNSSNSSYAAFNFNRNLPRNTQVNKTTHKKYRGTVWWIGRLIELGTGWSTGVEFDELVPGGGDGTWFSRHLFNCPYGYGRFLPVHQLRKVPRLIVWPTPLTTVAPIAPARSKTKKTLVPQSQQQTQTLNSNAITTTSNNINISSATSLTKHFCEIRPVQSKSQYKYEQKQLKNSDISTTHSPEVVVRPSNVTDYKEHYYESDVNIPKSTITRENLFKSNLPHLNRPHSATSFSNINNSRKSYYNESIPEVVIENSSHYSKNSSGFDEESVSSKSTSDRIEYSSTNYILKNLRSNDSEQPYSKKIINDENIEYKFHGSEECAQNITTTSNSFYSSSNSASTSYSQDTLVSNNSQQNLNTQFAYSLLTPQQHSVPLSPSNPFYNDLTTINQPVENNPSIQGFPGSTTYAPVIFGLPQGATYAPLVFAVPTSNNNTTTYSPLVYGVTSNEATQVYAPIQFGIQQHLFSSDNSSSSIISSSFPNYPVLGYQPLQQQTSLLQNNTSSRSIGTSTDIQESKNNTTIKNISTNPFMNPFCYEEQQRPDSNLCEETKAITVRTQTASPRQKTTTLEDDSCHLSRSSTISISRLLKKLEAAISRGDHDKAAVLAKDLATLKVNCSVTRSENVEKSGKSEQKSSSSSRQNELQSQQTKNQLPDAMPFTCDLNDGKQESPPVIDFHATKELEANTTMHFSVQADDDSVKLEQHQSVVKKRVKKSTVNRREIKSDNISRLIQPAGSDPDLPSILEDFTVQMYVEDRSSHQGPIDVTVNASMTVGELRSKVCDEFGFPPEFQRWILGRRLAEDNNQTLEQHRVTNEGCPVFLYLVATRQSDWQTTSKTSTLMDLRSHGNLKSSEHEEKMKFSKQKSLDSPKKEFSSGLVSPALSIQPGAIRKYGQSTNEQSNLLLVEDPVKGNELIRKEEEMDMKGTKYFSNILQGSLSENQNQTKEQVKKTNLNNLPYPSTNDDTVSQIQPPINGHQKKIVTSCKPAENTEENQSPRAVRKKMESKSVKSKITKSTEIIQSNQDKIQNQERNVTQIRTNVQNKANVQQFNYGSKVQSSSKPTRRTVVKKQISSTNLNVQSTMPRPTPLILPNTTNHTNTPRNLPSNQHSNTPSRVSSNLPSSVPINLPNNKPSNVPSNLPSSTPSNLSSIVAIKTPSNLPTNEHSNHISNLPANGWVCPRCTLVNPQQRPGCEACATEKPDTLKENKPLDIQNNKDLLLNARRVNESEGVVMSRELFECRVCFNEILPGSGVILRDCLHMFCRECLAYAIQYSETAAVKCPYKDTQYSCDAALQERELKALVTEDEFERHLNKSVKEAANTMENVFYCKTPDCKGFCVFEDNVNVFFCNVCYKQNCLTCQAQHAGQSCKEYQELVALQQDMDAVKTRKFFEDMIKRGDGIPCPHCSVMLVRKWGCDWMRCPMCRTEICWVTRGPRWGPKGNGDTSGGCQCGIKGRKCHPKCTYCH